ncbi:predicted protein [Thalassiosira pseudonana CCMP1335]|uniref:F-box domain-containing protein n=1 Tax=Thalassiosira pseudonana TaxID=35128 RepID=B8C7I5_THAPS|nr:predicted protein [Thalassiosira pseudonana CCMP1335]EED90987.1 predicted protein [Thalassiosira pseudonana CCMP1335]
MEGDADGSTKHISSVRHHSLPEMERAFNQCLHNETNSDLADDETYDWVTNWRPLTKAVQWNELLDEYDAAHSEQQQSGRGSSRSASKITGLKEVLQSLMCAVNSRDGLSKKLESPQLLARLQLVLFNVLMGRSLRSESDATTTVKSSPADRCMLHFIGNQLPSLFANEYSSTYAKDPTSQLFDHSHRLDFLKVVSLDVSDATKEMWVDIIQQYTALIYSEIQLLFANTTPATLNSTHHRALIAKTRRCVEFLYDLSAGVNANGLSINCISTVEVATNAILRILCALDDTDVSNLRIMNSQSGGKMRETQRSNLQSTQKSKRRRKINKVRSSDIIQALHEAPDISEGDDDHDDTNESEERLCLGNADRRKRARRLQLQSCSTMQISLKQVLNASEDRRDEVHDYEASCTTFNVISSLTLEAALLRRDLYQILVKLDTFAIRTSTRNDKTALKKLSSSLIRRFMSHHRSPSARLSVVLSVDYLREFHLGGDFCSYRLILEDLLSTYHATAGVKSVPALFYAEIVSECSIYASPTRLLESLSRLMEMALNIVELDDTPSTEPLLQAIRKIMVRRQHALSELHDNTLCSRSRSLSVELRRYKRLVQRMAVTFDERSRWILASMSLDDKMKSTAILQAEGVLSLFCGGESDEEGDDLGSPHPSESVNCLHLCSIRSAHDRLGRLDGFNKILSHPSSYATRTPPPFSKALLVEVASSTLDSEPSPFLDIDNDTLHSILSFLGYRSLLRVSRCCKLWRQAASLNDLWNDLYFAKFQACFEDEFCAAICFFGNADRLEYAKACTSYDWKHIFKSKYILEKKITKANANATKTWRIRSCNIIGCTMILRSSRHAKTHRCKHEKDSKAQKRKLNSLKALKTSIMELRNNTDNYAFLEQAEPPKQQQSVIERGTSSDEMLSWLIFPFLDAKDLLKPVCKLWSMKAEDDKLWQPLYRHHFGEPITKFMISPSTMSWKEHFVCRAKRTITTSTEKNSFGWTARLCPILGCCYSVFRTVLDYDIHLLMHEERYCKSRLKELKKKAK